MSGNLFTSAFSKRGGSLSANISGESTSTPVGVERLEISLFRMVLRYWPTIISFCQNTRVWQRDRQTNRIATAFIHERRQCEDSEHLWCAQIDMKQTHLFRGVHPPTAMTQPFPSRPLPFPFSPHPLPLPLTESGIISPENVGIKMFVGEF